MNSDLQVLEHSINQDPKNPQLKDEIKRLKFKIYSQFAENPQNLELQRSTRQFCELEVLYYLSTENIDDYKLAADRWRNITKLTKKSLGVSEHFYQLLGVYLLYLLSYNKIELFYSEIELLPLEGLNNPSITFVTQIEQSLSIGNYSQVMESSKLQQSGLQSVFLNRIINTIRDQKALSAQVAYQQIRIQDALELFHLNNVAELQNYSRSQNFHWKFDNNYVYLDQNKTPTNPLNSENLIKNQLLYVHELDKIV